MAPIRPWASYSVVGDAEGDPASRHWRLPYSYAVESSGHYFIPMVLHRTLSMFSPDGCRGAVAVAACLLLTGDSTRPKGRSREVDGCLVRRCTLRSPLSEVNASASTCCQGAWGSLTGVATASLRVT